MLGSGAGLPVAVESGDTPAPIVVEARGYGEQVWLRFRRDRAAIAGGIFVLGERHSTTRPWIMVRPVLAILLTMLAFNLLGDGLRDVLDPRTQR